MAELFTQVPLFPGKSEGLQIFEHMCVLGKPKKDYLKSYNLPQNMLNFFNELEEIVPYDIKKLLNKNKEYDEGKISQAADLISKLICWNPNERLSAAEALRHDFFS